MAVQVVIWLVKRHVFKRMVPWRTLYLVKKRRGGGNDILTN